MTITDTTTPTRSRRPARSRKAPARWRHRRRLIIPRGRLRSVPLADIALHQLMIEGDIYKVGRTHYLVAPIGADLLETLIVAAGSTEDDEPSVGGGQHGTNVADIEGDELELEGDGDCDKEEDDDPGGNIDDEPHDEPWQDMEPSLGWADIGSQLNLSAGYVGGMILEGSNPPLDDADIDAQRGRIASRWPRPADDGWGLGREKASGNIVRFMPAGGKGRVR
jgi:hypothetical protein